MFFGEQCVAIAELTSWPCVVVAITKALHGPDKALYCQADP